MFNSSWQCLEPAVTCSVHIRRQVLRFRLAFYRAHSNTHRQTQRAGARLLLATQLTLAAIYISLPIYLLSVSYRLCNGQRRRRRQAAIFHLIYRTFYLCTFYCLAQPSQAFWLAYFVIIILLSLCLPRN